MVKICSKDQARELACALTGCGLAIVLVLAVIFVSGLTVKLMERPKLQSNCPRLIETWKANGLPKHIQIKCKEFLT